MIMSPKKLARMTRKWQKRTVVPRAAVVVAADDCGCSAPVVDKGCFVVYACDGIRFVVPLDYLKNDVFQQVLEMAEQEYGSQSNGPIRVPFKAAFLQYTVSLIERHMRKDLDEELRMSSITSWRCLSTSKLQQEQQAHPLLVVG